MQPEKVSPKPGRASLPPDCGDPPEHQVLVELNAERNRFLAFLHSRVSDEQVSEDLLQTAYLRLVTRARHLRDPDRAQAWFYRVLRNLVADYYRAKAKQATNTDDALLEDLPAPTRQGPNTCPCVSREMDRLQPQYAEVLRAVEVSDRPVQEFAHDHNVTPGNASVRLHRARRALRARVQAVCGPCAGAGCFDCSCA